MGEAKETAKEKALEIIESCTICDHFEGAKSYLDLYLSQFNDEKTYNELVLIYEKKKQVLNCKNF